MNKSVYFDLLRDSITRHAERPCMQIKRQGAYSTWTYGDFHSDLNACVTSLKTIGFGKGANGVVIGENCPEWVIAHHSIVLAGGTVVPVDPNLSSAEIEEIIRLTQPTVVFCSPVFKALFSGISQRVPSVKNVLTLDPADRESENTLERFLARGDSGVDAFAAEFKPEDPIAIIFTSGTTGKAKGVVLVQRNYTSVILHGIPRMRASHKDTILGILPLHHVFGHAACVAAALATGMNVVYVPVIKGPLILEALNDCKVTILPAVPQMLELFYKNIQRGVREKGIAVRMVFAALKAVSRMLKPVFGVNFSRALFSSVHRNFGGRLRVIISGASSLKKEIFDGFRLMGFNILEGYGLTETFGPVTICPIDDPRQAAVGKVFDDNQLRIDKPDAEGNGEVCFRGSTVFAGYYNNNAATEAVFDSEGWFHTGDIGKITSDGFLYLTGRIKDIIVLSSGKNVYPDEIEGYYSASTCFEEIGIFGSRDENKDEVVAGVFVPARELRKKYTVKRAIELVHAEIERLGSLLPSYKKVGRYAISLQPLPRTTTKKIKKNELRKLFDELNAEFGGRGQKTELSFVETALMESPEFAAVKQTISAIEPETQLTALNPRSNFYLDVGIDSLKMIDLVVQLEEIFGVSIPPEGVSKIETIADAINAIRDASPANVAPHQGKQSPKLENAKALKPAGSVLFCSSIITKTLSKGLLRVTVQGIGHTQSSLPLIFASNHESIIDPILILSSLPWSVMRKTFAIGKAELSRIPVLKTYLKLTNMVAVQREGDVMSAMNKSLEIIKAGGNLLLFPEGTRSRDGSMGVFKSGVGRLVLETNAAVIPVRIKGTFQVWPSGKAPKLFPRADITIVFGKALARNSIIPGAQDSTQPTADEITGALRDTIAGM